MFQKDRLLTTDMIENVFDVAGAYSYSLLNLYSGKIYVSDLSTLEDREFPTVNEAARYLAQDGGITLIWNDEEGIEIIFVPRNEYGLARLSMGFSAGRLRDESPDRLNLVMDVRQIFVGIADRLNPYYGYATDEYGFEELIIEDVISFIESINRAVLEQNPPPVLFWLNYFSNQYSDLMGAKRIEAVDGIITRHANGRILQFSEYPWDVNTVQILSCNEVWAAAKKQ
jgi:hypothetical protein